MQASPLLKGAAAPSRRFAAVNAAVTAVPHARLLSVEKAHPADLGDLHAQTWHREIIGYNSNSFTNATVLAVKLKKY